ncbi:MAG: glutamate synthase [Bacteroidota bacterium]
MMDDRQSALVQQLIESRRQLAKGRELPTRKVEAEGGCGVIGVASSVHIKAKHLLAPVLQMKNRGNGKGGGIAAVGLNPKQLGVSQAILDEDYLLQIAYLDPSCRTQLEDEFIRSLLEVHHANRVPSMENYRDVEELEVEPPQVWRYFCRVKPEALDAFVEGNSLGELDRHKAEDEFIFQNSFRINSKFYAADRDRKAFVLSHGRNMLVFKIVGYAQQVIQYYQLEELEAHVLIGHQRYPTKGKVWHPGGSHPFIGLDEALVHNGDFANYYSITEYLAQRNIVPLFLTDTEVSVLLFDLLNRVYEYPLEYVIEALAPTTERDLEMLPAEKRETYREIQDTHIHSSPDGPWFFIIGRTDARRRQYQLLGITDTSMLRPQVFALQEGETQIGFIASEKQAIDALLRSLQSEDSRFWSRADLYWNARGGSYTDGGAFIFTVKEQHHVGPDEAVGGSIQDRRLVCTDKFGTVIEPPKAKHRYDPAELQSLPESTNVPIKIDHHSDPDALFRQLSSEIAELDFRSFWYLCRSLVGVSRTDGHAWWSCIELLTLLLDRIYSTGSKKRSSMLELIERCLYEIFDSFPSLAQGRESSYRSIAWKKKTSLRPPKGSEQVLACRATGFPAEGPDSLAQFLVNAAKQGWKRVVLYDLRGHRFIGCGLGPETSSLRVDVYGSSGDYLSSGLDGAEIHVHGSTQDQLANIMKSGKLVIHGDTGQTFMYGAKGGDVYVLGSAAGRPLINAVGRCRVVINGTCLDYLAESFMAGDPLNGGGFAVLNGMKYDPEGNLIELDTPYPGGNLFSLASGGALYIRDPHKKVGVDQLNGGQFAELTERDWNLVLPYLKENEKLFGIGVDALLTVEGKRRNAEEVYRKIEPVHLAALEPEELEVSRF